MSRSIEVATDNQQQIGKIKKDILRSIKGSKLETEVKGKYFCFLLPKEETANFPALLGRLRQFTAQAYKGAAAQNVISRFTVRSTSLDEVFLKLGKEAEGETENIDLQNLATNIVKERLSRKAHDEEKNKANKERQRANVGEKLAMRKPSDYLAGVPEDQRPSYDRCAIFRKLAHVQYFSRNAYEIL